MSSYTPETGALRIQLRYLPICVKTVALSTLTHQDSTRINQAYFQSHFGWNSINAALKEKQNSRICCLNEL